MESPAEGRRPERAKPAEGTQRGFVMSVHQLSDLWNYDMTLAHNLLGLPLRKCSAVAQDEENMPAMDIKCYQELKNTIKKMWIEAAVIFLARKTDECGWGLFVREDHDVKRRVLTATSPLRMGWVAICPGPGNPTYHRYLRSPCEHNKKDALLYLGGPLSICNQDINPTLRVEFSISGKEGLANFVFVQKIGKLEPGDEVFWTYCISRRELEDGAIDFCPESEWKLPCCSESDDVSEGVPAPSKRVCRRRSQPRKNSVNLRSYRFCTYCGLNAADSRVNMKCHIALKHAAQLCAEMLDVDEYEYNPDEPVTAKAFLKHLDLVSNVYNTLHSLGYKTLPACLLYDQVVGTPRLLPNLLSQEERGNVLSALVAEANRAHCKKCWDFSHTLV